MKNVQIFLGEISKTAMLMVEIKMWVGPGVDKSILRF